MEVHDDKEEKVSYTNNYEVVLHIESLEVISFDRFALKNCPSLEYDDLVKVNLNFVVHYLKKKMIL